jgi:positive regulator of sigma E activity
MIQRGVVQEVVQGNARVAVGGGEGCGTCNARESCMSITGKRPEEKIVTVENSLQASVGDAVEIELPVSVTISVIALTFLLPVFLLIVGYLIMMPGGSTQGAMGAVGGLMAGMVISLVANRKLGKKESHRMIMTAIVKKNCEGTEVSN